MDRTLKQSAFQHLISDILGIKARRKCEQALPRGVDHHNARLTDEEIRFLIRMRDKGATIGRLAKQFGVSKSTVHAYLTGRQRTQGWRELELL